MNTTYSVTARVLLAILLFCGGAQVATSQTLNSGDILFTGYHSNASTTDAFSFVTLVPITGSPSFPVVSFTDNGWLSTNVFRAGEQTITCTFTTTHPAGREFLVTGPSAGAGTIQAATLSGLVSAGTCTGSIPSFATSGDQVIAYRGTVGAPTLLAGLHMNVYSTDLGQCANTTNSAWDPTCITDNANFSVMPLGLAPGVSTTWIGTPGVGASEQDNAKFNACGLPLLTAAQVRAAVTDSANWTANSVAPPNFSIPSGCNFMSIVPTSASVSITGRVMSANGIALSNVTVTLTEKSGAVHTARTSPLGYYRFEEVTAGEAYILHATSKLHVFNPRVVTASDELTDIELVAEP